MAIFESPYTGLAYNRKLSDKELIRAIRYAAAGDFEAAQTYMRLI